MRRPLSQLPSYQALHAHAQEIRKHTLREWFAQDPKRFSMFSREQEHFLFDFSRNRISEETLDKLLALSEECEVEAWRDRMFAGECINLTENLPVQHVALRDLADATSGLAESQNRVLERMETLASQVREQGVTDVVHLGAGGSHLGQKLVCERSATRYPV